MSPEANANQAEDAGSEGARESIGSCVLTVAVGSTDLGKTFCSIVAGGARF